MTIHYDDVEPIVIETDESTTASVIWLHGLGADGNDFAGIVSELGMPADLGLRYTFPHAPMRPVTLNMGHVMRAWYDIAGLDESSPEDRAGLIRSRQYIDKLIQGEIDRGIPSQRIIVGGFSQGGALGLYAGLRFEQPLAGILALSCYLPLPFELSMQISDANRNTPVFFAHGRQDPVVGLSMGSQSYKRVREFDTAAVFHEYPMGHNVIGEEIRDIGVWMRECLG
ncbi:MAG TPA: carboxylesterase [Acidiferrobacteraceae bacterium]|nr:carboxylesterase [Acidiferrobacteraceae bacterium]